MTIDVTNSRFPTKRQALVLRMRQLTALCPMDAYSRRNTDSGRRRPTTERLLSGVKPTSAIGKGHLRCRWRTAKRQTAPHTSTSRWGLDMFNLIVVASACPEPHQQAARKTPLAARIRTRTKHTGNNAAVTLATLRTHRVGLGPGKGEGSGCGSGMGGIGSGGGTGFGPPGPGAFIAALR